MTNTEAIKELEKFVRLKMSQRPAFLDVAIEALRKAEPRKGITEIDTGCPMYVCPVCEKRMIGNIYDDKCHYRFCAYCGQALDWRDADEQTD